MDFLSAILTQSLIFLPLALAISVSYRILNATDMTLDGSFVLGSAVFARLITLGFSPWISAVMAILGGMVCGLLVSLIQRKGKVGPLLAGILASFILSSVNLWIMGRPNIGLLSQKTLFSAFFEQGAGWGWTAVAVTVIIFGALVLVLLRSKWGLFLRAMGDNPHFLKRLKGSVEVYRITGFMLTNALAALGGVLTAEVQRFADVGMGLGMTLTGIGAIILGAQIWSAIQNTDRFSEVGQFLSCLLGVLFYFSSIHVLLLCNVDPLYLKMILGFVLIFFLRAAPSRVL